MTPGIGRFAPRMSAEFQEFLPAKLPSSTEWTEVKPLGLIMPVVAMATGITMVGPDLCRRPEWIETSIGYAHAVFRAAQKLKSYPSYLRPLIYKFLPEIRGVQGLKQKAASLVNPELERRARMAREPGWEQNKPDDFIQWYTDNKGDFPGETSGAVLNMGMVSVNSTSNAAVNAYVLVSLLQVATLGLTLSSRCSMYDIATYQEYQEPLRKEIMEAMAKNDGILSKNCLDKCLLLDSFLKESQRMNPEIYSEWRCITYPPMFSPKPFGRAIKCSTC